jgi:hypothetical protein
MSTTEPESTPEEAEGTEMPEPAEDPAEEPAESLENDGTPGAAPPAE